jgi:hypothetical protein
VELFLFFQKNKKAGTEGIHEIKAKALIESYEQSSKLPNKLLYRFP